VKLGTENRKQMIAAAVLAVVLLVSVIYQFMPSSSTNASTAAPTTGSWAPSTTPAKATTAARHGAGAATGKKEHTVAQNLDPTLHLSQLAIAEHIQYAGTGRNIFVSQPDAAIPKPLGPGVTDLQLANHTWTPPAAAAPPPIPLKFFGFASKRGEAKKIFLSKGEDVFIAGEGEIVDRRYKVVRISPTSVEIQDVVGSGPPQSIPLTQG
jgi:hypothetical protein